MRTPWECFPRGQANLQENQETTFKLKTLHYITTTFRLKLKKKEPYGDFGGSYFHPELPAGLPEASFLLSHLLILNFTGCTLLWVTHLSLAKQEVFCNACVTQAAALSPLPFLSQQVEAALMFIQVHLHQTWQNHRVRPVFFCCPMQIPRKGRLLSTENSQRIDSVVMETRATIYKN